MKFKKIAGMLVLVALLIGMTFGITSCEHIAPSASDYIDQLEQGDEDNGQDNGDNEGDEDNGENGDDDRKVEGDITISGDLDFIYTHLLLDGEESIYYEPDLELEPATKDSSFTPLDEKIVHLDSSLTREEFKKTIEIMEDIGYKVLDSMFELNAVLIEKPEELDKISAIVTIPNVESKQTNNVLNRNTNYKIPDDENFHKQYSYSKRNAKNDGGVCQLSCRI